MGDVRGLLTIFTPAAIVAALALLYTWRKDRHRIRVTVGLEPWRPAIWFIGDDFPDASAHPPNVAVTAVNHGTVVVTLREFGLRCDAAGWSTNQMFGKLLPATLGHGESFDQDLSVRSVTEALQQHGQSGTVRVRGYCIDTLGKYHRSKPFPLDIRPYLGMEP